jgi:hypothetical protein
VWLHNGHKIVPAVPAPVPRNPVTRPHAALCIFIVLFGFRNGGSAAEDTKAKSRKRNQFTPSLDFSGYSGRFTADRSRTWERKIRTVNSKPGTLQASRILG